MNYREVEIESGLVAKISPMLLTPENLELCDLLGRRLESGHTLFLSEAKPIRDAVRASMVEHHPGDEADAILARLRFSSRMDSPFMRCVMALMDSDPKQPDEDGI